MLHCAKCKRDSLTNSSKHQFPTPFPSVYYKGTIVNTLLFQDQQNTHSVVHIKLPRIVQSWSTEAGRKSGGESLCLSVYHVVCV